MVTLIHDASWEKPLTWCRVSTKTKKRMHRMVCANGHRNVFEEGELSSSGSIGEAGRSVKEVECAHGCGWKDQVILEASRG